MLEINWSWFDGFDQITKVFSISFKLQIFVVGFVVNIYFGEYQHGRCFDIYLVSDKRYLLFFSIFLVSWQAPDTHFISGHHIS